MCRSFLFVAFLLLVTSCATVRLAPEESAALRTIEKYLQLDQSGARLDPNRHHSVAKLVQNPQTEEWTEFNVVSGWRIGRPMLSGTEVSAIVRYDLAGTMSGDVFTPLDSNMDNYDQLATVAYRLSLESGEWKLVDASALPFVSFSVARSWAKSLGAEAALQELADAEYIAKLKSQRAGHCNCGRLDF
ncbi:MAG TPA: hypothetical protein PLJ47_08495 [Candidatus Hydrogenedentes bacterium]|nr:hypothetical protein [Candidatus Hydrogenedentota bacterium]